MEKLIIVNKTETWKEKHNRLLKNKDIIIKFYNEHNNYGNMAYKKIAKVYGVSTSTIGHNFKLWGVKRKSGIKFLLREMLCD